MDRSTEIELLEELAGLDKGALAEDFAIGESIQSGLPSGANDELRFGRCEGALDRFNRIVEREIDAGT